MSHRRVRARDRKAALPAKPRTTGTMGEAMMCAVLGCVDTFEGLRVRFVRQSDDKGPWVMCLAWNSKDAWGCVRYQSGLVAPAQKLTPDARRSLLASLGMSV